MNQAQIGETKSNSLVSKIPESVTPHPPAQCSAEELIAHAQALVAEERRTTLALIEYLREIDRRMLFAKLGYSSLFSFCVEKLGLSEGAAYRRIAAMRLIRDIPEAQAKLKSGALSLSNAAKLQSAFRAQKNHARKDHPATLGYYEIKSHPSVIPSRKKLDLTPSEKCDVLNQVSGLSQKDCERKLFSLLPHAMEVSKEVRERAVGENLTELKFITSTQFMAKLKRLQELHSHNIPDGSYLKIFERLMEEEIERIEIKRGLRPRQGFSKAIKKDLANKPGQDLEPKSGENLTQGTMQNSMQNSMRSSIRSSDQGFEKIAAQSFANGAGKNSIQQTKQNAKVSTFAAGQIKTNRSASQSAPSSSDPAHGGDQKKQISNTLNSQNPLNPHNILNTGLTKRYPRKAIPRAVQRQVWLQAKGRCQFPGCRSRRFLEIDHRTPKALGGGDPIENLRILCRSHNLQQAQEKLGDATMRRFSAKFN